MLSVLSRTMEEVGKATEVLALADSARLLLLPYGARVLGLYAAGSEKSFFWTNPTLENVQTARAMFLNSGWHNTGGDRTWVAPELDVFFPDVNSDRYRQPRELEMSDYAVERIDGGVRMSRQMTLHLARPGRDVRLRLCKWFGAAPNPLRCERDMAAVIARVQYAGYCQRVALQIADESAALGIWNLLQLPPGGEMILPTYACSAPQRCFGYVPTECMTLKDRVLRVRVDSPGSYKIAVKAAAVCGRAGYVYGGEDECSLIVRNFMVNPSGEYVDVQRHDPDDHGYAFQMCRVDEADYGSFCEMEHHAPALGTPPDPWRTEDISQTWAFRGGREAIGTIARRLLGTGI